MRSGGYGSQAVLAAEAMALLLHVWKWNRRKGSGMKFRGRGAVQQRNVNGIRGGSEQCIFSSDL